MLRVLPALVLAASLAAAALAGCSHPAHPAHAGPAAPHHKKPPASYYLALGDSLSRGVEPDSAGASVETAHGYADQLYAMLRRRSPGLRLVKLGCPSETTATMIHGGVCRYRAGSQLAAAVGFLGSHQGRVALVTIDVGANDPETCLTNPAPADFASCVGRSIPEATGNLAKILTALRAADPRDRIIAMNYYLPALAQWRNGMVGEAIARVVAMAAEGYNHLLTNIYLTYHVLIANVFGAFHTSDFSGDVTVSGYGRLPANVAAICRWTWECAAPPRGPNQHANQAGYQVIAQAFMLANSAAPVGHQAQAAR